MGLAVSRRSTGLVGLSGGEARLGCFVAYF